MVRAWRLRVRTGKEQVELAISAQAHIAEARRLGKIVFAMASRCRPLAANACAPKTWDPAPKHGHCDICRFEREWVQRCLVCGQRMCHMCSEYCQLCEFWHCMDHRCVGHENDHQAVAAAATAASDHCSRGDTPIARTATVTHKISPATGGQEAKR